MEKDKLYIRPFLDISKNKLWSDGINSGNFNMDYGNAL